MSDDSMNDDVTMAGEGETLLANRYRIVRQLGQGGMGSVCLAEDVELDNRRVAIKMLPPFLISNKRAYKQIKSEALVSLKLTHQNIAALRSFEENGGNPFLVIDYIDGRSLDDYLAEKGKLTESETVALLSPIADALDYAHAKNIIHRDIKPGNVMIAKDGTPYILDFGIAREMQEAATEVTGKSASGTLKYMSPEQLHGSAPTAAQDVYSFATMVYECLTGAPPFARGQVEYQIEHDAPPPLPASVSFANAVMSGLAKKPEDRPAKCCGVFGAAADRSLQAQMAESKKKLEELAAAREKEREAIRLRYEQEAARREQEAAARREREAAERKAREEAEAKRKAEEAAERKRALELRQQREKEELETFKKKIELVKHQIREEWDKVVAHVKAHPEYGDCLPTARKLYELIYEDDPKDLAGFCERLKKLEAALARIRVQISGHDVVVCATLNGSEVGRATMLYGERKIDLPVRIKGRQQLTAKEGHLITYVRGNQSYYGWFSPSRIKPPQEGSFAMVPLRKAPSAWEITKALLPRHLLTYLWDVLLTAVLSMDVASLLTTMLEQVVPYKLDWILLPCCVILLIPSFAIIYRKIMRREMGRALRGKELYVAMNGPSAFKESELLLKRDDKNAAPITADFGARHWARFSGRLLVALFIAVHATLYGIFFTAQSESETVAPFVFGIVATIALFCVLCVAAFRKEKWHVFLGRDGYHGRKLDAPGVVGTKAALTEDEPLSPAKPKSRLVLWIVVACLCVGGAGGYLWWHTQQVAEAQRQMEAQRQRRIAEREQEAKEKAEAERRAREEAAARRAAEKLEAERKAEAARKAKAEADRKAKAEAERKAREEAEAKRKAEEEAKRIEAERALEEHKEKMRRELEEANRKAEELKKQREVAERERMAREAQKALEEAERARKEQELRELQERIEQARKAAQNVQAAPQVQVEQERVISLDGRTSQKFRRVDADTLSQLKFPPNSKARSYYEKASSWAMRGAQYKAKVKADYNEGRARGGPEWAELEAWLDWWK